MKKPQSGFTLVEVLVALTVLSVGLLGIAVLYTSTLKAHRSALLHTQAVALTADLAERIRASRVPAGAYSCPDTCDPSDAGSEIAGFDLAEWLANVRARLPGGSGTVAHAAGDDETPEAYTIELRWAEAGRASPASLRLRVEI